MTERRYDRELLEAISLFPTGEGIREPGEENNEQACSDGCSNDGDDHIDCEDQDCDLTEVCLTATEDSDRVCGDGLDNDGDLLYDGNDPDCQAAVEICDSGEDEDGDGLADEDGVAIAGAFFGGLLGGWVHQSHGPDAVFLFCAIVALVWLLLSLILGLGGSSSRIIRKSSS